MQGTLTQHGQVHEATKELVTHTLSEGQFFWLDLDGVDAEALDMLLHTFRLHPLAVEDAEHFGQRPKIDDYDDFTSMVVYGANSNGENGNSGNVEQIDVVEVHALFTEKYLITVHRGTCDAVDQVHNRVGHHQASEVEAPHIALLYLVIDALVDGFFPVLDSFDSRIDELEDAILAKPTEEQLGTLFQMKRSLVAIRKIVTPERDLLASVTSGVNEIPGMTDEGQRYFRDLYDHLIRISDLIDGYRDLLSGAMDTHLSTVSNRLNVVMKQLTIIATIFLPLSFLTGFFGQNFAWLVTRIGGTVAFFGLGIGLEVAAAVGLYVMFRKRGWLGGPSE